MRGQNDDRQSRLDLQEFLRQVKPVFAPQPKIGDGDIKDLSLGCIDGILPSRTGCDNEPHGGQSHPQQVQQAFIIVHNENTFLLHALLLTRPIHEGFYYNADAPRTSFFFAPWTSPASPRFCHEPS
jgi:hypothetical protein